MNIREIKRKVRISQVMQDLGGEVARGYPLTSWAPTTCPLHDDHDPSASVNDALGRFYCHACHAGGDVIDLVKAARIAEDVRGAINWLQDHYISDTPADSTTAVQRGSTS